MESGALDVKTLYKELGEGNEGGISLSEIFFMHYESVPKLLSSMQQVNGHHC